MDTNKKNKIAKDIFNHIKKEVMRKKDLRKNGSYFFENGVFINSDSTYDSASKKYLDYISVDGKEFHGSETMEDVEEITKEVIRLLNEQKKVKGWKNLIYTTSEDEVLKGNGWNQYWKKYIVLNDVSLLENPCKEFKSLQNYLQKYGNCTLKDFELFSVRMGGKRGRLYCEEGDRHYLANKETKCKRILNELRIYRGAKDTLTCKRGTENYIDPIDQRYSEYHEIECDGEKRNHLEITIKTPNGKVKYNEKIY